MSGAGCSVGDCPNKLKARDLCSKHYYEAKDAGVFETGCAACGRLYGGFPLCVACQPMVCVCPNPNPDAIGECRHCLRVYRPTHIGLMESRRAWIDYLDAKGVPRGPRLAAAS